MRDSTTYQAILDEGRAEGLIAGRAEGLLMGENKGRAEEARQLLFRLGSKRFGPPEPTAEEAIKTITDLSRLELLIERMLEVASWTELLQAP